MPRFDAIISAADGRYQQLSLMNDDVQAVALKEVITNLNEAIPQAYSLYDLTALVASIIEAAALARRGMRPEEKLGIEKRLGFETHGAWRQFACDLMDWAENRGLRVTTAKRTYTSKNWPSPFVRFFRRIQNKLPEDRRFFLGANMASDAALTAALNDVRRARAETQGKFLGP